MPLTIDDIESQTSQPRSKAISPSPGGRGRQEGDNELPGLYVHVPFCRSKCAYCDFYSIPSPDLIPAYLEAVVREAAHYAERFDAFDTLYFGGGTPSLLSVDQLRKLLDRLREHAAFSDEFEKTLEANPDDLTPDYLIALRELGFNRLSLGIQSFDDGNLNFLRRRHDAGPAMEAIRQARQAGFDNLSLDLMYGLPGQTIEAWTRNLETALEFHPEHLSCYQLTIEPHTPLGTMLTRGEIEPVSEETGRCFFLENSKFLERNGYLHYEISNFARTESLKSRHNSKYWRHVPYLGLGPSAHSFLNGVRWWNFSNVETYRGSIMERNHMPVEESETLTPEQVRLEKLYLGFRTAEGVALDFLFEGADEGLVAQPVKDVSSAEKPMDGIKNSRAREILDGLVKSGHLRIDNGRARPTREGMLIADRLPLLFDE